MDKNTNVTELPLIGDVKAKQLAKLNINTVQDLLFHIPFKYRDTSNVITIDKLKQYKEGCISAKVESIKNIYTKYRKVLTRAKLSDESGYIYAVWFNQQYLYKNIKEGEWYLFEGKVSEKTKNLTSPTYERIEAEISEQKHLGKITPYYHETEGITSKWLRGRTTVLKNKIGEIIKDPLDEKIIKNENLIPLPTALHNIHFPENFEQIHTARKRLGFDELLGVAIKIEENINLTKDRISNEIKINKSELNKFINTLPYKLTNDQEISINEILEKISSKTPMNLLLNGDVGSGKTIVSASAIHQTILNNRTAILLAPTVILAIQHYNNLSKLLSQFGIDVSLSISGRKEKKLKSNTLIIGTHSLLFDKDLPKNIGLLIIDEQHRFGVDQRKSLIIQNDDGTYPHFLMMTATPIPHTLTNILFGDMSCLFIREMPKDRIPIKSHFVPFDKRDDCFAWIKKQIVDSNFNNQCFIVFPLIEESEEIDTKAATVEYEELKKGVFKDINIGLLHGRMKNTEKEKVMNDFKEKKYNLLVSTSVIEVGIDIPDATIMVIEGAERFGLAQLHQLRGRVGRSNKESFCFVIPSVNINEQGEDRLKYFSTHSSGFDVSEYDLVKRGPGEVYGLKQSGIPTFKVASILDLDILIRARKVAKEIVETNQTSNVLTGIFK